MRISSLLVLVSSMNACAGDEPSPARVHPSAVSLQAEQARSARKDRSSPPTGVPNLPIPFRNKECLKVLPGMFREKSESVHRYEMRIPAGARLLVTVHVGA